MIVVENFVLVVLVFGTCIVEMTNETSYKKIDESVFWSRVYYLLVLFYFIIIIDVIFILDTFIIIIL